MLDNKVALSASNKPSKFRTRNWVEIDDDIWGAYSPYKKIRFKTTMLKSSLCDYSDAYIFIKGNISVNNTETAAAPTNRNIKVIFENCAPFTNCISKINNTQIDNAEYIDIVMPMYNLIESSNNYSKTSGSLWQYCNEIPAVDGNGTIVNFNGANATNSFNFKTKITRQTNDDGIINVERMVPLKYLSNFWRTLQMPLINCEAELILNWSANCVIIYTNVNNQVPTFTITEINLYIPVVTLSTQDNEKLLPQLKSGFKRKISWNKYLAKPELLARNQNLNYLIEPSFQGVNRLFVLGFEHDNDNDWKASNKRYYIPNVEIKDCKKIDGKIFFDQPVKNDKVTYENIRKIAIGQGDDYTTGCLIDYTYFKKYYKIIAVDLSKQQVLDADPKAIQQVNFTANLDRANTSFYFILEEAKETVIEFSQGTVNDLWM